MAYSNVTTLATMDAVMGAITTFISGLTGWTFHTNFSATPTVGNAAGGHVTIASNGTTMVGMRSTTTGISGSNANVLWLFSGLGAYSSGIEGSLNGDDGLGAGYTTLAMAGALTIRGFPGGLTGPFPNLYMFSNASGDYVHVVLEWSTGKFRHMAFGKVIQFGTWPGGNGSYFAGSFWSQSGLGNGVSGGVINQAASLSHALPFDNGASNGGQGLDWSLNYSNGTDVWISPTEAVFGAVQHRRGRGSVRGGANRMYKNIQESLFTSLVPLAPIVLGADKITDNPVTIRYVGQVPDMRMVNVNHLAPASEFTIGSDTWKCFPLSSKGQTTGQESSAFAGLAYKKI